MTLDEKIGHLTGKVDQILKNQQEEREWRQQHSGEGDATTHAILNAKVAAHEKKFDELAGAKKLITAIGASSIIGWVYAIFGK